MRRPRLRSLDPSSVPLRPRQAGPRTPPAAGTVHLERLGRRIPWGRIADVALGAAGLWILLRLWVWIFDAPWYLTVWGRAW